MHYANSEEILELEKHDIGSKYLLGLHFQNYKFWNWCFRLLVQLPFDFAHFSGGVAMEKLSVVFLVFLQ